MRACAPTAAMQRRLAELLNPPKAKRGQPSIATGVMVLPVLPGATRAEQEDNWTRMASSHCAKLMEDSKEDQMDKPKGELT